MSVVVLASPKADSAARTALARALERFPATVEDVAAPQLPQRLATVAADPAVEWIVVVDGDVVVRPDAFGSINRALQSRPAILGGRALVGASQRFGAMFGPARSGPDPFALVPIAGLQSEHVLGDLIRGPLDIPHRGLLVLDARFVHASAPAELDPALLHLDLAVRARAAARVVWCEPAMSFTCGETPIAMQRGMLGVRRYAGWARWDAASLHREPPGLRLALIDREMRVMGNFRGFAKQVHPPIDVLAVADAGGRAGATMAARALQGGGDVATCAPGDGDVVRRALATTGERYLLIARAATFPTRAQVGELVERLEQSARNVLALDDRNGAALVHRGRIVGGAAFRGDGVDDVIADVVATLPRWRQIAVGSDGPIVPPVWPPATAPRTLDIVFVAAAQPEVTNQTLTALLADAVDDNIAVVYPAGAVTTRKVLSMHSGLRPVPDEADPILALGLNRVLADSRADVVAIVRDDAQITHGLLARMRDAFRRIPRLGAAVPRVGGADRPEGLPELTYSNEMEMQAFADRRGELFAHEATLADVGTTPVIMIARAALDTVGGFDEAFGFSRLGVEDFTRRLRSANYLVARCDDAYAHLFAADQIVSFFNAVDAGAKERARFEQRWAQPRGFDPDRDRVAARDVPAPISRSAERVRILVPIADDGDWERARPFVAELAAAFRAVDPVDVAIGLDGAFDVQQTVAAVRELFAVTGVPMDETLNVLVDRVTDVEQWAAAAPNTVACAAVSRDALSALAVVGGAGDVRARFSAPVA